MVHAPDDRMQRKLQEEQNRLDGLEKQFEEGQQALRDLYGQITGVVVEPQGSSSALISADDDT
ncbi:hypothetical protein HY346_01810 [Candidatus Microgenomates bacterium]|nr:hypothetical protein [Candidatus Microgenomates bacterium]